MIGMLHCRFIVLNSFETPTDPHAIQSRIFLLSFYFLWADIPGLYFGSCILIKDQSVAAENLNYNHGHFLS
jgi:hypothetical protein